MLDDLNVTPERLEAMLALAGFNLQVPATIARKKGVARWTEYITVEEASREDETTEKGAERTVFNLKAKVIPGPGSTDDNVGKPLNNFMRVNFGVVNGDNSKAGANPVRNEQIMSAMALQQLKQIAQAAGLDLSGGLTREILDALFPEAAEGEALAESVLVGQHFAFVVSNDESKKNRNGENSQNVTAIFAAPEGV